MAIFSKLSALDRHRVAVAVGVIASLIAFTGFGIPDNISVGMLLTIVISVASFFWFVADTSLLLVGVTVGLVVLTLGAPSAIGTALSVAGILLLVAIPAAFGIVLGNFADKRSARNKP